MEVTIITQQVVVRKGTAIPATRYRDGRVITGSSTGYYDKSLQLVFCRSHKTGVLYVGYLVCRLADKEKHIAREYAESMLTLQ